MVDDPPYLTVGTEVSAKYKGAFCEAKIRKVARVVKCRVAFKAGLGTAQLSDDLIKGTLRVGATVEAKHHDKNQFLEATITKIQDCSQYTVVFDDGDITTLRRSALCLKSGRHFNESETLDQLPLTHPEHFSNPVVGGRRGVRRRGANADPDNDTSDEEDTPSQKSRKKHEHDLDLGKVVCVEIPEKKKGRDSWFPALIVHPSKQENVKIRIRDEYLVRSFKDGRYYTVPKKEITEFVKDTHGKLDSATSTALKSAIEKANSYLDKDELPPHWERDSLFGSALPVDDGDSDSDESDESTREKKDSFLAQLYKFMEDKGTPINKEPVVNNKELDLHKLYMTVMHSGGYTKVTNGVQWKNVTVGLGFGNMPSTSTINLVKQAYKKYLVDFEDFYRKLGCTIHNTSTSGKVRGGRSVIRGGTSASIKETKKTEEEKLVTEDNDKSSTQEESEVESAGKDTDVKKPEASEEPRRSRSRQESSKHKSIVDEDKSSEKVSKKKEKRAKDTSSTREDSASLKAEPPSPAPSASSRKGRGGSRKKKEKDDSPPVIDKVEEPQSRGISKDVKIQVGEKLSVYYPKGDAKVTYDAKVLEINTKTDMFYVHYQGWNTRYDEWVSRERIAENLSLKGSGQVPFKSQGRGPVSHESAASAEEGEKEKSTKSTKQKRGRSVTPSIVPVSGTGTRSKSGSIKRKRPSTDVEPPVKKKRAAKKEPGDASDSEDSKSTKPRVTPLPSKSSKISKDKSELRKHEGKDKETPNKSSTRDKNVDSQAKKVAPNESEAPKGEKENQTHVLDSTQIRSEMKGFDKIMKKTTGYPKKLSGSSASSGQKDIYDFEEDETPDLKKSFPRSPDKKDEVSKTDNSSSVSAVTQEPCKPEKEPEKPKKEKAHAGGSSKSTDSSSSKQFKNTGQSGTTTKSAATPALSPSHVSTTPAVKPSSSHKSTAEGKSKATSSTSSYQSSKVTSLTSPPPPQLVPENVPRPKIAACSSVPPTTVSVPQPTVPRSPAIVTNVAAKPPGPVPASGVVAASAAVRSVQTLAGASLAEKVEKSPAVSSDKVSDTSGPATSATKEPKVLHFTARKQELFPHLIQQQSSTKEDKPTADKSSTNTVKAVVGTPAKFSKEKAGVHAKTPEPKEKKKRQKKVNVDAGNSATPSVTPKTPGRKRAKEDSLSSSKSTVIKKEGKQKPETLPTDPPAITKIKETISTLMHSTSHEPNFSPSSSLLSKDPISKDIPPPKLSTLEKMPAPEVTDTKSKSLPSVSNVAMTPPFTPSTAQQSKTHGDVKFAKDHVSPPVLETPESTVKLTFSKITTTSEVISEHTPITPTVSLLPPILSSESLPVSPKSTHIPEKEHKETLQSTISQPSSTAVKECLVVVSPGEKKPLQTEKPVEISPVELDDKKSVRSISSIPIELPLDYKEKEILESDSSLFTKQHTAEAVKPEEPRPLTPSFLKSHEVLEPEIDEDTNKSSLSHNIKDESCSSLLCEEEIPGSPNPDDDNEKFGSCKTGSMPPGVTKDSDNLDNTFGKLSSQEKFETTGLLMKGETSFDPGSKRLIDKLPYARMRDLSGQTITDTSPPSTPESTSLSTETGSPHVDSGRITPPGEISSKSKESSDNDSGDNIKSYYTSSSPIRKPGKRFEPPESPISKRSRSRGRFSSPPPKKRRIIRKKSPDEVSRSFGYRGIRTSSGRKIQSALDIHEALKIPPPPPLVNLGKPPVSAKFGHLLAKLENITDPEDRINLAMKAITDIRKKYIEIKNRMQARERKEKRRKRKAREKAAAERQARLEASKANQ